MKPAFALIGAAALGAALFLAGFAAALLDGRRAEDVEDELALRDAARRYGNTDWSRFPELDAPLRWSDTGEAVETYQTFTLPTVTNRTLRSVG